MLIQELFGIMESDDAFKKFMGKATGGLEKDKAGVKSVVDDAAQDAKVDHLIKRITNCLRGLIPYKERSFDENDVRALFIGGDSKGMSKLLDQMEAIGFDSGGAWEENAEFFKKKLRLSKEDYMVLVKASQ